MLFFDNASTTRVFDEVREQVNHTFSDAYFNPSALYLQGLNVKNMIEDARKVIANKLSVNKSEIFFTSCATESNNWVINGCLKNKRGNIVTTLGEHPSVYECSVRLKSQDYDIRFAKLNPDSTVDQQDLLSKIDNNTVLVSIIHCSNETGAINDIASLTRKIKAINNKTLIHCDGVQAFCKIDTNLMHLNVDFYTISSHKIGGLKGIGALYIRQNCKLSPIFFGGGQESGLRSGTENTSGIIGFAQAIKCYEKHLNTQHIRTIFNNICNSLINIGWIYNGSSTNNSGFILSFSYDGIRAEILQHMLSDQGILIGLGSACSSKSNENRVLNAIGRTKSQIQGNIRISLSPHSTIQESQILCKKIDENLNKLLNNLNN